MASLASETTVYVSSLSKSVATGLRVGFVCAPGESVPKIERAIRATTWNTPAIMTAIGCGWMEDGTVARLEVEKRRDAATRQGLVADILGRVERVSHPNSYFVWLPLAQDVRADEVAMALLRERVSVSTALPFSTSAHVPHAIRLAIGSVDLATLTRSLQTVARVIAERTY